MQTYKFNSMKSIFSTIRGSFVPATLLLCTLLFYYSQQPLDLSIAQIFHYTFLGMTILTLILLYIANQAKPFFTALISLISYFVINNLKHNTDSFVSLPEFQCLSFLLPINLLMLHFIPQSKLNTTHNKILLLFFFAEISIMQKLCSHMSSIPYINITLEAIPLQASGIWFICLFLMLMNICFKKTIINIGLFYAGICMMMEMIYAHTPSGLTIYATGSIIIIMSAIITDMYHRYHYDSLNFVGSKNAYLSHANSKFPFKYTIALYSIDNYDKLMQIFGEKRLKNLEQMIINKIREMPYDLTFYRYSSTELIMVFKNEDAKHTYEFAENIRRTIAASEFIFTNGKNLKVTISICVSEKTRKDLNAAEVTERAHNALHKNHRFNCNITTKA